MGTNKIRQEVTDKVKEFVLNQVLYFGFNLTDAEMKYVDKQISKMLVKHGHKKVT